MFKKLLNGEYALKETFWKFGVLGLIICNVLFSISQKLLLPRLRGLSIKDYYIKHFSLVNLDSVMMVLTLFYFFTLFLIIGYSITIIFGTWRSSAEYNKSLWLRHLSRLFILLFAAYGLRGFF